jgi:hypothetical protein
MGKRFTLAEAQRLIPEVDRLMREAVSLKKEFQEAEEAMQSISQRIMMMGGVAIDRAQTIEARKRRDAAAGSLKAALESVQELGCVIKDLDIGLVDFPTLFRGQEVYLCWKLGETAIEFWHGVDEGLRGRKPIDQDFLDNHRGDRAH